MRKITTNTGFDKEKAYKLHQKYMRERKYDHATFIMKLINYPNPFNFKSYLINQTLRLKGKHQQNIIQDVLKDMGKYSLKKYQYEYNELVIRFI